MVVSEMLASRTQYAKEIAQKAEALRLEAEVEVHRYEGAVGVLKQVRELLQKDGKLPLVPEEVIVQFVFLFDQAQAELIAARGRVQQGEKTLDMLEALFQADVAAAQGLLEKKEAPKRAKGRHPGASIKSKRLAETAT